MPVLNNWMKRDRSILSDESGNIAIVGSEQTTKVAIPGPSMDQETYSVSNAYNHWPCNYQKRRAIWEELPPSILCVLRNTAYQRHK